MMKFKKIALTAATAVGTALVFAGCGGGTTGPVDVNGQWVSKGGTVDLQGAIESEVFELYVASDDAKGLYWKGDFPIADPTATEFVVTSTADTDALDMSLFGSQLKTKDFRYSKGSIHLDFTMMGTTFDVELVKK